MISIRVDNRLEGELAGVYESITGNDGKKVVEFLKNSIQSGETFEEIKNWVEETIPKSHENKSQRKLTDILCDRSIISKLPSKVKSYIKKVVNQIDENQKDVSGKKESINDTERKLDKFLNGTHAVRDKFKKIDSSNTIETDRFDKENSTNLEIGNGATTTILLVCVVLIALYNKGDLII